MKLKNIIPVVVLLLVIISNSLVFSIGLYNVTSTNTTQVLWSRDYSTTDYYVIRNSKGGTVTIDNGLVLNDTSTSDSIYAVVGVAPITTKTVVELHVIANDNLVFVLRGYGMDTNGVMHSVSIQLITSLSATGTLDLREEDVDLSSRTSTYTTTVNSSNIYDWSIEHNITIAINYDKTVEVYVDGTHEITYTLQYVDIYGVPGSFTPIKDLFVEIGTYNSRTGSVIVKNVACRVEYPSINMDKNTLLLQFADYLLTIQDKTTGGFPDSYSYYPPNGNTYYGSVLTSVAFRALYYAYCITGNTTYLDAALKALDWLENNLQYSNGAWGWWREEPVQLINIFPVETNNLIQVYKVTSNETLKQRLYDIINKVVWSWTYDTASNTYPAKSDAVSYNQFVYGLTVQYIWAHITNNNTDTVSQWLNDYANDVLLADYANVETDPKILPYINSYIGDGFKQLTVDAQGLTRYDGFIIHNLLQAKDYNPNDEVWTSLSNFIDTHKEFIIKMGYSTVTPEVNVFRTEFSGTDDVSWIGYVMGGWGKSTYDGSLNGTTYIAYLDAYWWNFFLDTYSVTDPTTTTTTTTPTEPHFRFGTYPISVTVSPGQNVTLNYQVINDGGSSGNAVFRIKDDSGTIVYSKTVYLDAGADTTIVATITAPSTDGTYTYTAEIYNEATGQVDASATLTITVDSTATEPTVTYTNAPNYQIDTSIIWNMMNPLLVLGITLLFMGFIVAMVDKMGKLIKI